MTFTDMIKATQSHKYKSRKAKPGGGYTYTYDHGVEVHTSDHVGDGYDVKVLRHGKTIATGDHDSLAATTFLHSKESDDRHQIQGGVSGVGKWAQEQGPAKSKADEAAASESQLPPGVEGAYVVTVEHSSEDGGVVAMGYKVKRRRSGQLEWTRTRDIPGPLLRFIAPTKQTKHDMTPKQLLESVKKEAAKHGVQFVPEGTVKHRQSA